MPDPHLSIWAQDGLVESRETKEESALVPDADLSEFPKVLNMKDVRKVDQPPQLRQGVCGVQTGASPGVEVASR